MAQSQHPISKRRNMTRRKNSSKARLEPRRAASVSTVPCPTSGTCGLLMQSSKGLNSCIPVASLVAPHVTTILARNYPLALALLGRHSRSWRLSLPGSSTVTLASLSQFHTLPCRSSHCLAAQLFLRNMSGSLYDPIVLSSFVPAK